MGVPFSKHFPSHRPVYRSSSFKVKIERSFLWRALSNDNKECRIRLWKNKREPRGAQPFLRSQNHLSCPDNSITVASWNCRGMRSSEPYLNVLSRSADIILIQEHWLWPYELHKLSSYLPEYTSSGRADHRLTESSGLSRGCGGGHLMEKVT